MKFIFFILYSNLLLAKYFTGPYLSAFILAVDSVNLQQTISVKGTALMLNGLLLFLSMNGSFRGAKCSDVVAAMVVVSF
jgi:hypothetical protein